VANANGCSPEDSQEVALIAARPRLARYCARLTGAPQAAEDLAQETLLEAWRNVHKLPPAERDDPPWPWLAAVARHVCLRWLRAHHHERGQPTLTDADLADPVDPAADPQRAVERRELAELLVRALAGLPAQTRAVMVARVLCDEPQARVAAALGISEGNVAMRVRRGKLALRRVLAAELHREAVSTYARGRSTDAFTRGVTMPAEPTPAHEESMTEKAFHRTQAAQLFNHVWDLLELPVRTVAQDDEMLHAAHASRHHWGVVGTPVNLARGEWQVSRVYSVLGRPEPALHHATRCLEICRANGISDFDIAFAHEALARANALAGNADATAQHLAQAAELGAQIVADEDRALFFDDLKTVPGFGA
jgi:RNA polymerase sigma factor (sigma-70 family)